MELFNGYIPIIPVQNTEPVFAKINLKNANQAPTIKEQRYHKVGCYPLNHFINSVFCLFSLWDKNFAKSVSATPPAYYCNGRISYYPCWRLFDLLLHTKNKALNIKGKMDAAKVRIEKAVKKIGGWERGDELIDKIIEFKNAGDFELAKQLIKSSFGYYSFINDLQNFHLSYSYSNGLNVFEQSEIIEKYLEFLNNLPALYESFPPLSADELLVDACKEAGYIF
jgi:hypothetical protein